MVASRGCPLRCSYCSLGSGSTVALPYRRRSVGSVLAELRHELAAREVSFIDFEDENLSLDRAWFLESDYLETGKSKAVRREVIELSAELAPHAVTLVQGFGIPDPTVRAPLI